MFDNFKSGLPAYWRSQCGKIYASKPDAGEKVSITSSKPQTTRNRILGVVHRDNAQLVILDTPGIHSANSPLNRHMVDVAMTCMGDVDLLIFVIDASKPDPHSEQLVLKGLATHKLPAVLVVNKVDLIEKERLLPLLAKWQDVHEFQAMVPVSAKLGIQVDELLHNSGRASTPGTSFFSRGQPDRHARTLCGCGNDPGKGLPHDIPGNSLFRWPSP